MAKLRLLEYVETHRPPYFDPDTDLRVFDEEEEEWYALFVTSYSFPGLVDALEQGQMPKSNVGFATSIAREYLTHLHDTGVEDRLHNDPLMNRERLVTFADAGYTTVADFLGTADPIDISRETGVDRDVISNIVTNHLDGFSTAGSFGTSGPFDELEPLDAFPGWTLTEASPHRIRWVSAGRFNLTISPAPDGSTTVACNAPEADQNVWYRKGRSVEAGPDESLRPEDALERAHEWLADNQLEYEDDLAQFPYIGASTRDYLALEYGITSEEELRSFVRSRPGEFDAIFGEPGTRIRSVLQERVSGEYRH